MQTNPVIFFDRCAFRPHDLCEKECVDPLYQNIKRKRLNKGAYIFRAGDRFTHLYNLRNGFVKLEYPLENTDYQVARFHIPGDYFGLVGASGGTHRFNTIALTDIEVCAIASNFLEELYVTKPEFSQMIHDGMSERMVAMAQHFFYLSSYSVERRLAKFLLDFQDRLQSVNLDNTWINLPMSREDLKSYLGTTIESLSRAFSNLQQRGCFEVSNRAITNIDFVCLQTIVEGSN